MSEPIVIAPDGELDLAHIEDFRAALSEGAAGAAAGMIVDLSRVTFLDSTALGALVEVHKRLRRAQRRLAVVAPAGTAVAVLLNLTGLQNQLLLFETLEDALRS